MEGCALSNRDCNDPADFVSARIMRDTGVRGHGSECRWQETVKNARLGMCFELGTTNEVGCATNTEACSEWDLSNGIVNNSNGFVPQVAECSVETTNFGRCSDGMCAWDPMHCLDDHSWTPFDQECTCDQVQVGACSRSVMRDGKAEQEVFCAVSQDACDSDQTWTPPRDVEGLAGFECFLCREDSPPSEIPAKPSSNQNSSTISMTGNDLGGGISSQTAVVAVSAVGAAVAVLIFGVVGYKIMGSRRAAKEAADAKLATIPPLSDIRIPSETDPEAPSIDADNASVLSDGSHE